MDQVIQIVTAATYQARKPPEEQRGMIERALKLRAKTYEGTSQSSRKKGKKWTDGRGSERGAASSKGYVWSPAAIGGGRSSGSSFPLCPTCPRRHLRECRMNMTGCFHCGQEGHFI